MYRLPKAQIYAFFLKKAREFGKEFSKSVSPCFDSFFRVSGEGLAAGYQYNEDLGSGMYRAEDWLDPKGDIWYTELWQGEDSYVNYGATNQELSS